MVRVGGGWVALDEFLVKNDPCRGNNFLLIILDLRNFLKIFEQHNFIGDRLKDILGD